MTGFSMVWRMTVSICVLTSVFLLSFSLVSAQLVVPGFLPAFGGIAMTEIPCNTGLWMTVSPPRPASLMLLPSTIYRLWPPPLLFEWVKGNYIPSTIPCFIGFIFVGGGFQAIQIGSGAVPAIQNLAAP